MSITESPAFPLVDVSLRAGRHITTEEIGYYEFIVQNFEDLTNFYQKYDCCLVEHSDGFFYLFSHGEIIPTYQLNRRCVQVGQTVAYLSRQPIVTLSLGAISVEDILQTLQTLMTRESLKALFAPISGDATADKTIVDEVVKALRVLSKCNFVVKVQGEHLYRPTPAIGRFADMARYDNTPSEIAKLRLENSGLRTSVEFDIGADDEY